MIGLRSNKRAQILLPVGGHIEINELPEEAAIRETLEEAGIAVELYDSDSLKGKYRNAEREKVLINSVHTILGEDESDALEWYSESELDSIRDVLLKDIYLMGKEVINVYKG